jgi:polyisoprenoid-binding protein YceI
MCMVRVLVFLALAPSLLAQLSRPIDVANSRLIIHAHKSGLFSFAGHDHEVSAPISSGSLDETNRTIRFSVNTNNMQVLDPGESDKNRAEIRQTMLGDKLLNAEKYPAITFQSISIRQVTPSSYEVRGELLLHGVRRPIALSVTKSGEHYTGSTKLKQTDYGMQPVSAGGGTVKTKDEVEVEFNLAAK